MSTPSIQTGNVRTTEFFQMMKDVKSDQKHNVVTADRSNGDITVYTFDEAVPANFKEGIPANLAIFTDNGADDEWASESDKVLFSNQVAFAGNDYQAADFYKNFPGDAEQIKIELNDRIGIQNVTHYVEGYLDSFSQAIKDEDHSEIKRQANILVNIAKQLHFGQVFVPQDQMVHRLNRPQHTIAQSMSSMARQAERLATVFQPD